jgi:hypothetical protein
MESWVSRAGTTFKDLDWFVPPYMQGGVIRKLAAAIDAAPESQRHAILEVELRRLYGLEHLASMLLERYQKVDIVQDFAEQIGEAIEAHALGLDHAAVSTLLPVIEGILRKLAIAAGRDVGSGTKRLADEIEQMAERERGAMTNLPGNDALIERVHMLEQLRDFMRDRLLVRAADYEGLNNLNRHGILHGVFESYGAESNFQKLVSFLDGLTFFITLNTSGVSCFAPDYGPESRTLALYFRGLAGVSQLRPRTKREGKMSP